MSDLSDQSTSDKFVIYFDKIDKGICPHCDQPMEEKQVSRSVYALPCYHRLYQGRAHRKERIHPFFREQNGTS